MISNRLSTPSRRILRTVGLAAAAIGAVALVGCQRFSGKYEASGAVPMSVEFKSGSSAYLEVMGTTLQTDYTVDGDKVTFKNVNGSNLVMTEEKDGTLTGPMGMTLKKKQ